MTTIQISSRTKTPWTALFYIKTLCGTFLLFFHPFHRLSMKSAELSHFLCKISYCDVAIVLANMIKVPILDTDSHSSIGLFMGLSYVGYKYKSFQWKTLGIPPNLTHRHIKWEHSGTCQETLTDWVEHLLRDWSTSYVHSDTLWKRPYFILPINTSSILLKDHHHHSANKSKLHCLTA